MTKFHYVQRNQTSEFQPADVGLAAVDLKTVAGTLAAGVIDIAGMTQIGVSCVYTFTGGTNPTQGAWKVQAQVMAEDGTQLSELIDIISVSAMTQATGATYRVFAGWSAMLAPAIQAYASGATFAVGANLSALRGAAYLKFKIDVTQGVNNASTSTASVYVTAVP